MESYCKNYIKLDIFVHLYNILNLKVVITDFLWIIPTFVVSIVAAVRETQVKNLKDNQDTFNIGAFGSAAVILINI